MIRQTCGPASVHNLCSRGGGAPTAIANTRPRKWGRDNSCRHYYREIEGRKFACRNNSGNVGHPCKNSGAFGVLKEYDEQDALAQLDKLVKKREEELKSRQRQDRAMRSAIAERKQQRDESDKMHRAWKDDPAQTAANERAEWAASLVRAKHNVVMGTNTLESKKEEDGQYGLGGGRASRRRRSRRRRARRRGTRNKRKSRHRRRRRGGRRTRRARRGRK